MPSVKSANNGGDSEDSGGASAPGGVNRAPGVWVPSETRWTVDGSSLYASPPPTPGHNASFALDNDPGVYDPNDRIACLHL